MATLPLAINSGLGSQPISPKTYKHNLGNDEFWEDFRKRFRTDDAFIDLRCKRVSSVPISTLDHLTGQLNHIQALPSLRYSGFASGDKEQLRSRIATELNAGANEVALMRNTTEALNNAIMGFPFKKGDEVIVATHEYDSMIASLRQQELLKGIKVVEIQVPYKPESQEQIVQAYREAITPRTKMFLVSHVIWISGQIYPVKEICKLARKAGIFTVIDAAQSFSHIPVDVEDIGCDYLGASLHKWAAAPLGTGFLYIKEKNIEMTMPLMGHYEFRPDSQRIEKFEGIGTITPVFQSAVLSLDVWRELKLEVKTERMQHLKQYWVTKLAQNKNVAFVSNTDEANTCGFAFFALKGRSSKEVSALLLKKYNIVTQAIEDYKNDYVDYTGVNAISIATSVLTLERELDRFCDVIDEIA